MIHKQVIFNVGGALSVYTETDDKKIINDLGKSDEFNPITDFLIPMFEKREENQKEGKYLVDQLIISHPHKDHISAIEDFDKYFSAEYITCPNSNTKTRDDKKQPDCEIVNWDGNGMCDPKDPSIIKLKQMIEKRELPLQVVLDGMKQYIYWIPPQMVEKSEELNTESYANNISLLMVYIINGHPVLLPGDLQKEGLAHLLETDYHGRKGHGGIISLKTVLGRNQVSVLVAPHHGLKTSFCTNLFDVIKNNKTKCLNVVSEKPNNPDEARTVDGRYAQEVYCEGKNNLKSGNGDNPNYMRRTSGGHICIDYSDSNIPNFKIISDKDELIDWWIG